MRITLHPCGSLGALTCGLRLSDGGVAVEGMVTLVCFLCYYSTEADTKADTTVPPCQSVQPVRRIRAPPDRPDP